MSEMPARGPFCREISERVCVTCPILTIAEEKWQIDTPPDTSPFDAGEKLKDVAYAVVHPVEGVEDKETLSDAMQQIHRSVLAISPSGAEEDDIGFYPASESDEIVIVATDIETTDREWLPINVIPEEEFSDSAKAVLACLRRNQETACMEGIPVPSRRTDPTEALSPQISNMRFGIDILRALLENGSVEDMRAKVRELADVTRGRDEDTPTNKEIAAMNKIQLHSALQSVIEALEEEQGKSEED